MAIVEIFTQTQWSCWCGNLFGVSGYPVTVLVATEMATRFCMECHTRPEPHPSLFSSLARPPLG